MTQRIEGILKLVPGWGSYDAAITPLVGGITNQNYRVDLAGESFVVRLGGKNTHQLGINREHERICTDIAARQGVGAEVIHYHASASGEILITRFIFGSNISEETATQPEMLLRIVEAMRRYHQGDAFPGRFSPFETVRNYHQQAQAHGITFPDTLPQALLLMTQIEEALDTTQRPIPCHNDLLASNFIDDGQLIRIIDWEYAGMGDPFFDLGNFAANQTLSEEQCAFLLHAYSGKVNAADLAHLHLMRLASDLRESFWCFLQLGISDLDFDYRERAHDYLHRFLSNVAAPGFERWLRDVKA